MGISIKFQNVLYKNEIFLKLFLIKSKLFEVYRIILKDQKK